MEEDVGVKATVTRLRRRLSVEQSEEGSMGGSPGPATPTKKRGGRLAAKPQLDLIEENTPVSSPRKTRRKSLATDVDEKTITPSRRSTRIKSNSSIVSETLLVHATDSPRAKRAARRNSQAGSDNDGPATPARQTRRTRKDSASSVENQESGTLNKPLPVAEMVIEEEPENVPNAVNITKSSPTTATEELSPNSARKSKRLLEKRNRRSGSQKTDQDSSSCSIENKSLNIPTVKEKVSKSVKLNESNDNLSESSMSLLNNLENELNGKKLNHNKSASALHIAGSNESKRNRTESWPAVAATIANESSNFSDNELFNKRKEKSNRSFSATDDSTKSNKSSTDINEDNTSQSLLDRSSKRKKKKSLTNFENAAKLCEDINTDVVMPNDKKTSSDKSDNTDVTREMAMLFENSPKNVQVSVYYEDSDSNSVATGAASKTENLDSEDQCVPEVSVISNGEKNILSIQVSDDNSKISNTDVSISQVASNDVNNSCEPMDIDETIHEEILQKSLQHSITECQSLSSSQHSIIGETDNSKRNTSISGSAAGTLDQSKNDKRKSSISNSNTPDLSKNDKRKSSISYSAVDTPNGSKNNQRKTSLSNSAAPTDGFKNDKRKTSLSNSTVDTPDGSKNNKRKTSLSNNAVDTPDASTLTDTPDLFKKDKRKSSISNTVVDTPNRYINDKRTLSVSNSRGNTPDLSNNENNKSTLILSQLKDVSATSDNVKSPKSALINEVLSKSDFNEKGNNNKKIPKGNLSLNDVKGTPKHNSIQKLTMQTSTPIITQQGSIKTKVEEIKHESVKKNKSNFSKSINETHSTEEDSEDDDEPSVERNMHLDDEAEEASDDYESGDSQDEEERMYEAENEVIERGETLTSNDDISNDTDYEKDSFVVSSDQEDNELLSGSGDDLSLSDNELTMSKKSKKKYNDRKLKEQKNASREMFESRHKLNSRGENSPTPKTKKNRMRIDSSLLASDEEVVAKTKTPNRMRLDSTLDTSVKEDEINVSLNKSNKVKSMQGSMLDTTATQGDANTPMKKKKNKSLQDSMGNKSAMEEREITVCNESIIDKEDPLQMQLKQEPKTPQKDFDMSVVQVQQEIESVQMTASNSMLDQTGPDPLQDTMDSESSESEEIMQNYDSVLNELNKNKKTKFNNKNVSLNMGSKSKKNQVDPIFDQLNLTQAKKSKKNKDHLKEVPETNIVKVSEDKHNSDNEDSSSSIDLQLLFSEDNCGSDDEQLSQQNKADDDNMFIPLKKSPGKTNLQDSIGMNTSQKDTTLNESTKMKKKRKSSLGTAESVNELDNLNVSKNVNTSINENCMKKKKKNSLSEPTQGDLFFIDTAGTLQDNKDEYGDLNEPPQYEHIKKKKKNKSVDIRSKTEQNENTIEESNSAITPKSEKKKKKYSISEPPAEEAQDNTTVVANAIITPKSEKKKKKHSVSEPSAEESEEIVGVNATITPRNEKKEKKRSISEPPAKELQENNTSATTTPKSEKKKKKKHSLSEPSTEQTQGDLFFIDTAGTLPDNEDNPIEESHAVKIQNSDKKKKKQKVESLVHDDDSDGAPDEAPYQSEKASEMASENIENESEPAETGSAKKKHKKKKKKLSPSKQSGESIATENIPSNSKKRKRESSNAEISPEDAHDVIKSEEVIKFVSSNKKRKLSQNEDNMSGSSESKQSKRNKKNRDVNFQVTGSTIETTETQVKKNKKRKYRDEDGDSKKTKISKDSSFQEVHVPRLPDSILNQLDEKPRKKDAAKVISTSNFIVENARQKRAKPSSYLEESIYLDEKSPLTKKEKPRMKKPKVLPFIPTASISDSGFTTNFRINKLSQFTTFEAEPVIFSKENYLQKKKIKRLGTYDRYKTQMHHKMSKF